MEGGCPEKSGGNMGLCGILAFGRSDDNTGSACGNASLFLSSLSLLSVEK